ncbi:ATP-dependent DNA helicase DDX11 isoform X2 [Halyomorpha halys]|uniref:ATP-dependent DNA helicase DDX11 isoform X2 n=1 Tax=Halyomorpha halys TaxID=286706 RepID=UPI0034D27FEE
MDETKIVLDSYREKLTPPADFNFPFSPYTIQTDFMKNLYTAIEERKLGIFESPTGTEKQKKKVFHSVKDNSTSNLPTDSNIPKTNEITEFTDEDALLLDEFTDSITSEESSEEEDEIDDKFIDTKIIFCSRTHSQLSQFISELKKTVFANHTRVAPLASRQSYCINKDVNKYHSVSLVNEKCLQLQRNNKAKVTLKGEFGEKIKQKKCGSGCPKMKGVTDLGEQLVATILDVEELKTMGEKTGSCPYYASRSAVSNAELVIVPYNTLLHKTTREACGLELENSVIIIDEAHNILETISNIHSSQVSGAQLTLAYNQLTMYKDRYEKKFSANNLMYLKQIIYVIGSLIKLIGGKPGYGSGEASAIVMGTKIYTIHDFISCAQIDTFNMYKLVNFCLKTKLTHKISGFTEFNSPVVQLKSKSNAVGGIKSFLNSISKIAPVKEEAEVSVETEPSSSQPLVPILSLLENLTLNNKEGRVVVSTSNIIGKAMIKFLLLDPAITVTDIISKARSVILAGGTMEPKGELKERLFIACGADHQRIMEFSCSHIIPPNQILPIVLTKGPTGKPLDFSYESRSSLTTINEFGRVLVNICNIVPAGIVCFFPSYEYENTIFEHLNKHGIIENISKKKQVFREPKKTGGVDEVLSGYAKAVKTAKGKNGALLFSVVGGKLSEGLNFSDELGRCVMVVGMPYPNIKSPELIEKMKYLEQNVRNGAGKEYYEACCMKAVNQSIGRAIRHQSDFATVLLLDQRYSAQRVLNLLPAWIMKSLIIEERFPQGLAAVVKFFKQHDKTSSLSAT